VNYSGKLSEDQYNAAMGRIDKIFHAEPGTSEFSELALLCDIVECHENTVLGKIETDTQQKPYRWGAWW